MVYYSPEAKERHTRPDELKRLTDYFRNVVIEAVEDAYPVVDAPGPGVLRIRTAITDVTPTNPLVNIATVAAILLPLDLGGAAIEAGFLDSISNERLAALVDRNKGTPSISLEGLPSGAMSRPPLRRGPKSCGKPWMRPAERKNRGQPLTVPVK